MYTHNHNAAISSQEAAHALFSGKGIPTHYRAEYNPLSGRWMVLDDTDTCYAAGLSKSKAESMVSELS